MERLDQTDNKIKADITDTTSYVTFGNQANDPVVDDPDIIVGQGMKLIGSTSDYAEIPLN